MGGNLKHVREGEDVAAGHVREVDAGLARHVDERGDIVDRQAVLEVIVLHVHAHEQRHVLGHVAAHLADALQREAGAVFKASAVAVGAVIDSGREELVREIGVGSVELHGVESGLDGELGALAEGGDYLVDVLLRHVVDIQATHSLVKERTVHKAAVEKLNAYLSACLVHGGGELLEFVALLLGIETEVHLGARGDVYGGALKHVERAAALHTGDVVGYDLIADVIVRELGIHTGHEHAVLELKAAKLYRGKKFFKLHKILLYKSYSLK